MKPKLIKVIHDPDHSFSVREDMIANINSEWHYHIELELIYFQKGSGIQFIGDSINHFKKGDIVLVGSNLPHYWRYNDTEASAYEFIPYSTVIHFNKDFLGEKFLSLPEAKLIVSLLERSNRGVLVRRNTDPEISVIIKKIFNVEGLIRITTLLECLLAFANSNNQILLSSVDFKNDFTLAEKDRIHSIYNYIMNNFSRKITLEEISTVAGMTSNSFCRYFKSKTGKTFFDFLIEIRISYACKLLIDNKISIKEISSTSGFNNVSCFHKNFKLINGKTPKEYQEDVIIRS